MTYWLDNQTEKIHKKLMLNRFDQIAKDQLKEVRLDQLTKNGLVQSVFSKKQRQKEIDKNNRIVVQAL